MIIGKQFEDSENYQEFIKIINKEKIKFYVVEAGQRINIEKNLYFDVLWPNSDNVVMENILNNNSIVAILKYKDFKMLFTGDIEEIAEEKILQEVNEELLKAEVLKIAHHGSKSSTSQQFLNAVSPKIALIGVSKINKFGHPNDEVIKRLRKLKVDIYRTNENGEINLLINSKGRLKVMNFIK